MIQLCSNYAGIGFLKDLYWRNNNEFATSGVNHLFIWTLIADSLIKPKKIDVAQIKTNNSSLGS